MNRTYIKNQTYSSTYRKGNDLYYDDKVWDFQVQEEDNYDFIDAMVKGSGRNIYQVTMDINRETDEMESCECECPAFMEYPVICKHCVAVLLEYVGYQGRRQAEKKKTATKLENIKGVTKGVKLSTTPELKALLNKQTLERTYPVVYREKYEKVRLEPILVFSKQEKIIEFRIGIERMYVLKDVFSFAAHMEQRESFSYGKKLEFVHSLEAFEPESQELAAFLVEWARRNKPRYGQPTYSYYGYRYGLPELRYIPIDEWTLEHFMKAVGNCEFTANIANTGERSWQRTEELLEQKLKITGKNSGLVLSLEPINSCECEENYFYFLDGKIYHKPIKAVKPIEPFLLCVEKQKEREVYIEQQDIPVFCRELLPSLKDFFTCEITDFDETAYQSAKPEFKIYLDAPQSGWLSCKAVAVYGEKEYSVYDKSTDLMQRDITEEAVIAGLISAYCNAYDEKEQQMVLSDDEELLYLLLTEGIPKMQEQAEVFISDAIKKLKVQEPPVAAVGISLSGDLLELKITAEDMRKEELLEILSRYSRRKKFYRLKNGNVIHVDEEQMEAMDTIAELRDGLRLTQQQLRQEEIQIPRYRALYLDEELQRSKQLSYWKNKGFQQLIDGIKEEKETSPLPDSLKDTLREYQKQGVFWIKRLKENGFGGILADDMGLGKTLQVITFLLMEYQEGAAGNGLIVTPASLVFNWESEFNRFAPELPVKIISGTAAERGRLLKTLEGNEILVTSYDLLKRDEELYQDITFTYEIIDEAQYIKNHRTQAAKAVKNIKAGFRLALTGTPMENRLSELWSIFDFLMPGFLYEYQRFREELEAPIVQNQDERAMARLRSMITPFILRRLKKDVLKDLPDKLEESRYAKLEGEQQKLYDAHVKRLQMLLDEKSEEELEKSRLWVLSELTKLRQICCDPSLTFEGYKGESAKLEMCMDTIKNAVDGGHKILLFSQFTTMLEHIQKRLDKEKISYYTLTGATSKEKRTQLVEQFNQDDTSVFCISLKAGGTGLNLTAADIVIHYDPWWNLAVQNQATDRAHRIGQENVVVVYKLIASGTIEENIQKLQEKKRELADQVLSGEGISSAGFSKEELQDLLKSI